MTHIEIHFDTTGRIAQKLGVPLHRVTYILKTRKYIQPTARAGRVRVYDQEAIACIRHELGLVSDSPAAES